MYQEGGRRLPWDDRKHLTEGIFFSLRHGVSYWEGRAVVLKAKAYCLSAYPGLRSAQLN